MNFRPTLDSADSKEVGNINNSVIRNMLYR
jgi:hypothetical protein